MPESPSEEQAEVERLTIALDSNWGRTERALTEELRVGRKSWALMKADRDAVRAEMDSLQLSCEALRTALVECGDATKVVTRVRAYSSRCAVLRVEPSTRGLRDALDGT